MFGGPVDWHPARWTWTVSDLESTSLVSVYDNYNVASTANYFASVLENVISRGRSGRTIVPAGLGWSLPDNIQLDWARRLAEGSNHIITQMDQVNVLLNIGNMSAVVGAVEWDGGIEMEREWRQRMQSVDWRGEETIRSLLENIYYPINLHVYAIIPSYLKSARQMDLDHYVDKIINEASCIYDNAALSEHTFYKTLTAEVPKEKLMNFLNELAIWIKFFLKSDNLDTGIQMFYENVVEELKKLDFNSFTLNEYKFLLEVRTLLLQLDLKAEAKDLDELYKIIQEGYLKIMYGRWPEVETFLDNLLRRTFASRSFWVKLGKTRSTRPIDAKL